MVDELRSDADRRKKFWQLISGVIGVTALCFLVSTGQILFIHDRMERDHRLDINSICNVLDLKELTPSQKLEAVRWKTLASLEANELGNEYHEVNISIWSRLWLSYLGSITGLVLALVGANFMREKIKEPPVQLDNEDKPNEILKASLSELSPGIIFAFIGAMLIITSLLINRPSEFGYNSKYTREWTEPSLQSTPTPAPSGAPTNNSTSK